MRSKEQILARYYLAELWNDSKFRADWQRVQNPDLSPEERVRADSALHWRVLVIMTTKRACEILGLPSD